MILPPNPGKLALYLNPIPPGSSEKKGRGRKLMELMEGPIMFAAALGFTFGVMGCLNMYAHHNDVQQLSHKAAISRVDGLAPLAYTKVTMYNNGGVEVTRDGLFRGYTNYEDSDGDGKVDRLYDTTEGWFASGQSQLLYRTEDYAQASHKFDQADQVLRVQLDRFKPYFDELPPFSENSESMER